MALIAVIAPVVVAVLAGAVLITGALLPAGHTATRSVRLPLSQERLWAFITDVDRYASWHPGVTRTQRQPAAGAALRWREYNRHGKLTFEVTESEPPSRWVTRIAEPGAPFGGTWTYTLASDPDGGTILTVTEDGEVYNPLFRFLSRFVVGRGATLEKHLNALESVSGEPSPSGS
jgi:uncharacterized protein YndB with AHSA1/START domain